MAALALAAPAAPPVTYQYPRKVFELRGYADRILQKVTDMKSEPSSIPGQLAAHAVSITGAIEKACAARNLDRLEPFAAVAVDEIGRLLDSCLAALARESGISARLKALTLRPKPKSRSSSPSLDNYRNSLKAVTVLLRIEGGQSQLVYSGMVASPGAQDPALLHERITKLRVVNQVIKTALLAASNMTNSLRFPIKNVIQTVLQFYEHIESAHSKNASTAALLSKIDDFVTLLVKPGGQNIARGEEIVRAVEEFFRAVQSIIVHLEILKATETITKYAAPDAVQAVIDAADASLKKARILLDMSLQVDTNDTVHQILHALRNTTSEVKFSSALPARPKILHGRDEQLHSLVEFVVDCSRPIRLAIMGAGGLGKTTLANAVVQDANVAATFGDRRFFVSAEAIAVVDELVAGMLATFGLSATSDALAYLLRHFRSQDRTLLVLDNLETIWNSENSEQRNATERVLSQLDEVASLTLIITCRGTDLPPDIVWANRDATTLSTFSPEAALATFTDIAPDVPAADEAVRDALLDAIDYMPLAVTLLARLVTRGHKMPQLYSRWESVRTEMLHTHSNGRLDNVDASIQLSLGYLPKDDPEPLRLLSLSAQLPDGMRVPMREQLEGLCGFRDIDGALDILQGLALVYVTADGTVRMLSPIRLYVVENHALPASLRTSPLEIYCSIAQRDISADVSLERNTPVAAGGFSDVYRAFYGRSNSTLVAVKRPRFNVEDQERKEARLMKECSLLSQLRHENILPCLGFCFKFGTVCMVMPWAENGSLRWFLKRNPDVDRHSLLYEVASALVYLHTRVPPVIHGDLHVDNVLISADGRAQLSDFGLSRVAEDSSRSASVVGLGVVAYQAPELQDHSPTTASDIFAFGMLIVETYSGARPLRHCRNAAATIIAINNQERPARDEITRSDFREKMWQLAQDCWAHNPLHRPDAEVLRVRLYECID